MRLIALLAALCAERYLDIRKPKESYHWVDVYAEKIKSMTQGTFLWRQSWSATAACLLPFLTLVLLVIFVFSNWLFGLVGLVLDFALLWYCLGPGDLQDELTKYQAQPAGTPDAIACAELIVDEIGVNLNDSGRDREITKALFWQSHERTFSVLFWFVVFGGFGAALYRLTWFFKRLAAEGDFQVLQAGVHKLLNILAWVPARLLALTYLLAGNFHPGIHRWKAALTDMNDNQDLVIQCGSDALGVDIIQPTGDDAKVEQQEAMSLVMRSLLLWVTVISVMTILIIIA